MKATVHTIGFPEFDAYFKDLPLAIVRKPLRKATRDVAKFVLQLAKEMSPWLTGALSASLKVSAVKYNKHKPTFVATSVATGEQFFTGDQYYGGFLEFGTVERKHKSGKSVGKIPQERHDFLRPALLAFKEQKLQMMIASIQGWVATQRNAVNNK